MLKRKECHGDMADIHVYTAKKLEGMADSLENLARTFDGDGQMGRNLSREDGLAAPDGKCHGLWGLCQM